jgi:RND superfamily putative drug exporter
VLGEPGSQRVDGRLTLVVVDLAPAVIALLGDRAWGLPGWLDRVLPRISLEGEEHQAAPPGRAQPEAA